MQVSILGPLEVRRDGKPLPLGGAKQRALLAILVIHANHVVAVEQLAELLWPDESPADPAHVIEVYVSQLRKVLDPVGPPYRVLERKPAGYILNLSRDAVDSLQFDGLVAEAANLPPDKAAVQLSEALKLWRGPALREFATESFALGEVTRLNELRLHALELRIDADLGLGRHHQLIAELSALVSEHPLRERLCGQLMLALYRSGRQAEASDIYQKTRERLVEELGMEPGPDLQALLKRILQQDPGLAQPGAERAAAPALPTGTVTFLLTDLEGSTQKWESHPEAMRQAVEMHDAILDHHIGGRGGVQIEAGREGDSVLAVFTRASDAISAAVDIQRDFARQSWPTGAELHGRIAIHSGEAELRGGHYYGRSVYRCARLLAIAHGDQVLVSQATRDLVVDGSPEGVDLRDLGSHRLRDLERPEVVHQVIADGIRTEFPPLRSLDPRRHNLPISTTTFVGRDAELATLKARLASARLVSVIGSAGTGKTRLAQQVAAEVLDAHKDGVWFVELAPIADASLVPNAVAEALGVQERAGESISSTLLRWFRDKTLLLVIDNCEHVISAVAELTNRVLRKCPDIRVVTTSREPLRIGGEVIVRIGSMDESDAVQLFVDRLGAGQPGFRLTADNAESVTLICRRVEGIPLAIELAAGRGRMMSPAEILARLQDSFRLLAGGPRSFDERHQTLQAAIDWSYQLLNDEEKRAFRRLSVFKGGFTLDAAEAVCESDGKDSTLLLVGQLVDKSLIGAQESTSGRTRYALLEAVREYAYSRLTERQEVDGAVERHASYFLHLAENPHPDVSGPDRTRWFQEVGYEVDNFRAVFDAQGVEPNARLRLAAALGEYWFARGELSEGRARLETTLAATSELTEPRANALLELANIAIAQGQLEKAVDYCGQSLSIFRGLGDSEGQTDCLQLQAEARYQLDDFEGARSSLNLALDLATRYGFDRLRGACFWRLGTVDLATKNLPEARHHLEASLSLGRATSDAELIALSLLMLGNVGLWEGSLGDARVNLIEALQIWARHANPRQIANLLESLAAVDAAAGDRERALKLGGAAEGLRRRSSLNPSSPVHREVRSRLDEVRRSEGGQEIWAAGTLMSRDEAVQFALTEETTEQLA